jgi:hypothetical protein
MKNNIYIQVEISSTDDIETMMKLLNKLNKVGPHGRVSLAYGLAQSEFKRGTRFINIYDSSDEIKYSCTRNKQMPLYTIEKFKTIK